MLAELEEVSSEKEEEREMPSLNHSIICSDLIEQLNENKQLKCLPELTLNIGNGITPDISVYEREKIKANFWKDITCYSEMPVLAIEVISASHNIQDLLEKSGILVQHGVKAVWTIEPYSRSIFVTTKEGGKIFYNQEVESEGIKVDFNKIFSS